MRGSLSNFNPRSHKGSDAIKCNNNFCTLISIHAPTRGATEDLITAFRGWDISIHAPTRGATHYAFIQGYHGRNFNPRSHKGSDRICRQMPYIRLNFNPRSHKGSDNIVHILCGVDGYFNPRSHKGSDF